MYVYVSLNDTTMIKRSALEKCDDPLMGFGPSPGESGNAANKSGSKKASIKAEINSLSDLESTRRKKKAKEDAETAAASSASTVVANPTKMSGVNEEKKEDTPTSAHPEPSGDGAIPAVPDPQTTHADPHHTINPVEFVRRRAGK